MTRSDTRAVFDETIHAPNRLHICAMLARVDSLAFASVRDALKVADPVLSKHLKVLQNAGHLSMTKTMSGSRTRTWVSLTPAGRKALEGHLTELRRIGAVADAKR
ncbi:MAG: transcriptional regulator [Pseudonocardiaceae bacterium]